MSVERRSISLSIVVLILLGFIPALYLFQHLVRLGDTPVLHAEVVVRVNDRNPTVLPMTLFARPGSGGAIGLAGDAVQRTFSYPWKPTAFESRLDLELAGTALAGAPRSLTLGTADGALSATYYERYLEGARGEFTRIPCEGTLVLQRFKMSPQGRWQDVTAFEGSLDLACRATTDTSWRAGSDVEWTLKGPLRLEWGD